MGDTKHTPGPWEAEQQGADWHVKSEAWGGIVTRHCYPTPRCDIRVEGDARLIAAAPDLLEACRGAQEFVVGLEGAQQTWSALYNAIRKAEGD